MAEALDALVTFTKHEKRDEMEAALGEGEHTNTGANDLRCYYNGLLLFNLS